MAVFPAFLLHGFKFVRVPGLPDKVIKAQDQYPDRKRNQCQVFEIEFADQRVVIEPEKLAHHPVRVGADPDGDGQVMAEFRHVPPGAPGNDDRYHQGRNDHDNPQWFPYHTPGHIFEKPENNMQVFHFSVAQRDDITVVSITDDWGFQRIHGKGVSSDLKDAILIFCRQSAT